VSDDLKRICLLGAESTGKTTLARALAEAYETGWNPEYGRAYTELGRDPEIPWTSVEFTTIAQIQCWYEDFLAGTAQRLFFCDTDAFTTALFHEAYLGEPTFAFDALVGRPYDLFLICGLDVPWRHDGIREFDDQRQWMHDRFLERARSSGTPWVLLEGSREQRLRDSRIAIDRLLGQ
jgi:HTH-type transcriptional repressor of NAD biosynthesis genes